MRKAPCTPRKTPVRSKIEEEYIVAGLVRDPRGKRLGTHLVPTAPNKHYDKFNSIGRLTRFQRWCR